MLLPPPQPAIATHARISANAVARAGCQLRPRVRDASAKNHKRRIAAIALTGLEISLGPKKNRSAVEFATVATVTVALAVALEVKSMTFVLNALPVAIEQDAFGAVVEQDRKDPTAPHGVTDRERAAVSRCRTSLHGDGWRIA